MSNQPDRNLYEQLVRDHSLALYRYAYRMIADRHSAEDLVQDAFGHAWRKLDSLRDHSKAKAWLMAILRNLINQNLRRDYSRPESIRIDGESAASKELVSDAAGDFEQSDWVQTAVGKLDDDVREVVLLVMMEAMSTQEAAHVLGIPKGTVLSRLHRGREKLRQIFQRLERDCSADTR